MAFAEHARVEGQVYCTAMGAREIARSRGWKGPGGGLISLEGAMAKLARESGGSVLWRADDSVTVYAARQGKVRQVTHEAGSDAAIWLIQRFRKAADRV